ncbi:hypothetical protein [Nocardioides sp. zg-DK7169]|uniref:hypothetical protein n=1 Tax=Nocardioides sp. zg-DK7169 TaxID=2736600 RepID=UPI001554A377|nr:hypothetical protein [Nocardioides sp. zg-DK7169]NPC97243.1 hypothetical protein [Nocardioides sp. zg-DK7169]
MKRLLPVLAAGAALSLAACSTSSNDGGSADPTDVPADAAAAEAAAWAAAMEMFTKRVAPDSPVSTMNEALGWNTDTGFAVVSLERSAGGTPSTLCATSTTDEAYFAYDAATEGTGADAISTGALRAGPGTACSFDDADATGLVTFTVLGEDEVEVDTVKGDPPQALLDLLSLTGN